MDNLDLNSNTLSNVHINYETWSVQWFDNDETGVLTPHHLFRTKDGVPFGGATVEIRAVSNGWIVQYDCMENVFTSIWGAKTYIEECITCTQYEEKAWDSQWAVDDKVLWQLITDATSQLNAHYAALGQEEDTDVA
jgi:hypothetical protein